MRLTAKASSWLPTPPSWTWKGKACVWGGSPSPGTWRQIIEKHCTPCSFTLFKSSLILLFWTLQVNSSNPLCFNPDLLPLSTFFQVNYIVWPRSEAVFLNEKLCDLTLMPPLTVFSNVWVQVAMKGKKKVLEHHRNLSSAEGKLISSNWCVSSGGISPGFKNSRFWAEETSLLAALFLDGPLLGLTSSLSLPVLVAMLWVSEDKCALMLQINSLSQRFPQPRCWFMTVQIWLTVIIYIVTG